MPSTHSSLKQIPRDTVNRIETEEEYELAIERIESLWDAADGTPEAQARDVLVAFVEEYETRHEDFG